MNHGKGVLGYDGEGELTFLGRSKVIRLSMTGGSLNFGVVIGV